MINDIHGYIQLRILVTRHSSGLKSGDSECDWDFQD